MWAARPPGRCRTATDGVEPHVETKRQMRLGKPARAASIVNRPEPLLVGRLGGRSVGHHRPCRDADAAADVAPPRARSKIERELRTKIREALCDGPKWARWRLRSVRPRCRHAAADAERHRAVLERVRVDGDVAAKPSARKLRRIESPAQREVRIGGKRCGRAMEIDDKAGNGRRLLRVSRRGAADDSRKRAENSDRSQGSQRFVIVPARPATTRP